MTRDFVKDILQENARLLSDSNRWTQVIKRLNTLGSALELLNLIESTIQESDSVYRRNSSGITEFEGFFFKKHMIHDLDLAEELDTFFGDLKTLSDSMEVEMKRYVPISLVACIEGYFRLVYAELIDHGVTKPHLPYLKNAASLGTKFDIKMAIQLQQHALSLGTYIASQMKANSFDDICSNMSTLLGEDFRAMLHSKYVEELNSELLLLEFVPEFVQGFFTSLNKVFYYRHIFSHELATQLPNDPYFENKIFFDNVAIFLRLSESLVKDLLNA